MAFYRHFVERNDFEIAVATTAERLSEIPYVPLKFSGPAWWGRLHRTRFRSWSYTAQLLVGHWYMPETVERMAREFRPDAIFTIAGSWDWTCLLAQRLSQTMQVPLIASFNDWWDYGWGPYVKVPLPGLVERRFRQYYREADLALCTSEGMREALGPHPNSHILYPTGARMPDDAQAPASDATEPFTVCFGGNLGEWYGTMIERLIRCCRDTAPQIRFRIYGNNPEWNPDFLDDVTRDGTYQGQVPFEQLMRVATNSDLLLLPMGFGDGCSQVERTSFKTKFLDYLTFRRPILVWGPDYCSAVRVAREFDSAECVTTEDPGACATAIIRLASNPERRSALRANAAKMYADRFHPNTIHAGLVARIEDTIHAYRVCHTGKRWGSSITG
jgi:glycosyltransferase involved in cell wall biosynthesis